MNRKEKIKIILGNIVLAIGIAGLFLPIIPGILLIILSLDLLKNSKHIDKITNKINKLIIFSKKGLRQFGYKKNISD